jgi:hypothetical protein
MKSENVELLQLSTPFFLDHTVSFTLPLVVFFCNFFRFSHAKMLQVNC